MNKALHILLCCLLLGQPLGLGATMAHAEFSGAGSEAAAHHLDQSLPCQGSDTAERGDLAEQHCDHSSGSCQHACSCTTALPNPALAQLAPSDRARPSRPPMLGPWPFAQPLFRPPIAV